MNLTDSSTAIAPKFIAIDAMGGDFAPEEIVKGALQATEKSPHRLLLVGDESRLKKLLPSAHPQIEIVHTPLSIGMEEVPLKAVKKKPQASINVCMRLMSAGKADAMISAGNSGAVVASAIVNLGRIKGVRRPALASTIHLGPQGNLLLLDVGANIKADARHLVQFAAMAELYGRQALNFNSPLIALLNNGQEEYKGTRQVQSAHQQLQKLLGTHGGYRGFIEGDALLRGEVQIALCDGFVGNLLLKTMEGVADLIMQKLAGTAPAAKVDCQIDYQSWGGAILLGVEKPVYICHGKAKAPAITATIRKAGKEAVLNLPIKLTEALKRPFALSAIKTNT